MTEYESCNLNVRLSAAENISAYLDSGSLQVIFGDSAEMDVVCAVNYIKSGTAEIVAAVEEGTVDFNDNAIAKTNAFDEHAETSITEAKYWAEQSATSASSMANRSLNNLTAGGEAKFSAKQDVISDLATIRSGASAGATALQSGDNISDLTNDSGFITSSALPTRLSDLTDDLGSSPVHTHSQYLTSHQDISGKADTSLINVTNNGKILMAGMGMPSGTYETLTLGATEATYTAPANGWFNAVLLPSSSSSYWLCLVNNSIGMLSSIYMVNFGYTTSILLPVRKGDVIQYQYRLDGTFNNHYLRFYYAQGSESEAN